MNWDWLYMHPRWSLDLPTWEGRCLEIPFLCCRALCYLPQKIKIFFFGLFSLSRMMPVTYQNSSVFQCSEKLTPSQCKNDWNPLANILAMYDDGNTHSKLNTEFSLLNDLKLCKLQCLQLILVFGVGIIWILQCICLTPVWRWIWFQAPIFAHKLPMAIFIYTDVSFLKNAKLHILFQINRYLLGVVW